MYKFMQNSANTIIDSAIIVPGGAVTGIAYWSGLLTNNVNPIVVTVTMVMVAVLAYWRIQIARNKNKLLELEIAEKERQL